MKLSSCLSVSLLSGFLLLGILGGCSINPATLNGNTKTPTDDSQEFFTPNQDQKNISTKGLYAQDLPNVLIIGDSISIGYTPSVIELLENRANVYRIPTNGGNTAKGLAHLDEWLGNITWDVIHFNWGLHDLCYRHPESKVYGRRDKINGTQDVPIQQYEINLNELVLRLKATGANLIWASTTLVPEGELGRKLYDDQLYNRVAEEIMLKQGIAINDLNAFSQTIQEHFRAPGDVHFTDIGSRKLGMRVAEAIEKQF